MLSTAPLEGELSPVLEQGNCSSKIEELAARALIIKERLAMLLEAGSVTRHSTLAGNVRRISIFPSAKITKTFHFRSNYSRHLALPAIFRSTRFGTFGS